MFTLLTREKVNILYIHVERSDNLMSDNFTVRMENSLRGQLEGIQDSQNWVNSLLLHKYVAISLHWGSDLDHDVPLSVLFSICTPKNI